MHIKKTIHMLAFISNILKEILWKKNKCSVDIEMRHDQNKIRIKLKGKLTNLLFGKELDYIKLFISLLYG